MDLESQRAVEEEVVSRIPTGSDVGNQGNPAPPVQRGACTTPTGLVLADD